MTLENIRLTDNSSGASAEILAGFGFNCHQFRVLHDGRPLDVVWAAPDFTSGRERPSGSGIPILFPFPGRVRGTQLQWRGKRYSLREGDGLGNAIHGFVHERPWRVIEQSETRVEGQFQASKDDPSLLDRWPADFRITLVYELHGWTLRASILVENPDDQPLPCGLGTHPYFRVPLGGARADDCVVKLPITREWELVDMMTTGKQRPWESAEAFQAGMRFGDLAFDNVFTGLVFDGGQCAASVHDPGSGRTMTLTFDSAFRECVFYIPRHRQALCIEPYTCAPDPFRLSEQGVDAGLRVLAPGDVLRAAVEIRCQ